MPILPEWMSPPYTGTLFFLYYSFEHEFTEQHKRWIKGDNAKMNSPDIQKSITARMMDDGYYWMVHFRDPEVITPADTEMFKATEDTLTTFSIVRFRVKISNVDYIQGEQFDKVGEEIANRHDNEYRTFMIRGVPALKPQR